jgi:hypothetical protein
MRRLLLVLFFAAIASSYAAWSQNNVIPDKDKIILISRKLEIGKYQNMADLEDIHKSALVNIYSKRVRFFMELIAYLPLKVKPGQELHQLEIPITRKREKLFKKAIKKTRDDYFEVLEETISVIGPYANQSELIEKIILLDVICGEIMMFIDAE